MRRNRGRDWNINNRKSDFHHDILCEVGEQLRELDLCDNNSDGQPAAAGSDIGVGKPDHHLFGGQQHSDRDRRVRY